MYRKHALPICPNSISFLAAIINRVPDIGARERNKKKKKKEKRKFENSRSTSITLVFPLLLSRSAKYISGRESGHFVPIPRRIKTGVKAYPSKTCGYTFDLRPFTRFIRVHRSLPTLFNWKTGLENLEYIAHPWSSILSLVHVILPFRFFIALYVFLRVHYYHRVGIKNFSSNLKSRRFILDVWNFGIRIVSRIFEDFLYRISPTF